MGGRIDPTHGTESSLLLESVRDQPGHAGDHEEPVHRRRGEAEIGEHGRDGAVDVDRQLSAGRREHALHRPGRRHVAAVDTRRLRQLEQPGRPRVRLVDPTLTMDLTTRIRPKPKAAMSVPPPHPTQVTGFYLTQPAPAP